MAIDWSLARQPNMLAQWMDAYDEGKKMRREEATRNALGTLVHNPTDKAAYGELANNSPEIAMQWGKLNQGQVADANKAKIDAVPVTLRLLAAAKQNPAAYPQLLEQARQMGIPGIERAPTAFDPAWVDSQLQQLTPFAEPGKAEQLSGLARELQDAGYRPGTPEYTQAFQIALSGKYGSEYVDENTGDIVKASLPPLPQPAQSNVAPNGAPIPPRLTAEPFDFRAYEGAVATLGPEGAADFIRRNGNVVKVATPEQAMQLPSGTEFITPDGRRKVKP